MPPTPSPTAAAQVAAALRERIIDGRLPDGSALPRQDDLLTAFGVGNSTLRAALRMLETEGLITVRRGALGGAIVHTPGAATITRTLGLLLQSQHAMISDVATCLGYLEPVCAELCAKRADRGSLVVPTLDRLNEETTTQVEDLGVFMALTREFHLSVARLCGNHTMASFAEALELLWSEQALRWATRPGSISDLSIELRVRSIEQHRDLTDAIRAGDADRARVLASGHVSETVDFWDERDELIVATNQARPFSL